jgi:predicted NACHT family NTPase
MIKPFTETTVSGERLPIVYGSWLISKLESSIESAQKAVAFAYLNRHFFAPQAVSSFFTGRESELEQLKQCLITSPGPVQVQKRFVIFGLPGSGKTQFCCKFASENKQRY